MYTIVIVEDEKIIREGLVHTIQWEKEGFCVVGTAENGRKGLELVKQEHPDMVLTDIRMPVMDGIDLLKSIKSGFPETKVVLLSGYEEFEYAHKGMNYGASAYILKYALRDEIYQVLAKVRREINEYKKSKIIQMENIKSAEILTRERIREILFGNYDFQDTKAFDISMYNSHLTLVVVAHMENCYTFFNEEKPKVVSDYFVKLEQKVKKQFEKTCDNYFIIRTRENEIAIICFFNVGTLIPIEETIRKKLFDLIKDGYQKEWIAQEKWVFGIGGAYKGIKGIYKSYQEARWSIMYRNIDIKDRVVTMQDVSVQSVLYRKNEDIRILEKKMFFSIESGNKNDTMLLLEQWFYSVESIGGANFNDIKQSCIELVGAIIWRVRDLTPSNRNLLWPNITDIVKYVDLEGIKDWMRSTVSKLLDYRGSSKDNDVKGRVNRVIEYMETHYMDKITLKDMAEYVYLNPSYLSTVFKEQTGKSFSEYLIGLKVRKAADFIKNGTKVQEAAKQVGYEDLKHFRSMFKKYIGVNPGEYQ